MLNLELKDEDDGTGKYLTATEKINAYFLKLI